MSAAASFVTFSAIVLESSAPSPATGCAAPALVPGAIAATSAAIRRKNPADAACAPEGVTYTTTGRRAAVIAVVICRSDDSRPPGVLSSMIVTAAPPASAVARPRSR